MLSRRPLAWLFALTLLFGQAAAFAHALSHLQAHDTALPDKVCEVCVAQAHLGNAVPPNTFVLVIPSGNGLPTPDAASAHAKLAPLPACARSPPAPSGI